MKLSMKCCLSFSVNSLKVLAKAMSVGKQFHNLIEDGKKEKRYLSQVHCKHWKWNWYPLVLTVTGLKLSDGIEIMAFKIL